MMNGLLEQDVFGNTLWAYLRTLVVIVGGIALVWLAKVVVLVRLQKWAAKTESRFTGFIFSAMNKYVVPLVYFGIIYLSLNSLHLNPGVGKGLSALSAILVTMLGILFLNSLIRFALLDVYLRKHVDRVGMSNRFQSLMPALTVTIWIIGCVFLLDNLGFKISAIVAGLGIGGVAVALAASTVLADLFGYFVIMFDRPFVIGDFIIIGDFMGSVEYIGIKTTRVRSLGGEMLVFSNKDLTDSRIRNYKIMQRRRVVFRLGVTYDTSLQNLKEIPGLMKSIIQINPDTLFDRAHFFSYGDFNLVIEVVYFVLSADYNKYMDIQQEINFAIKEEFEKRNIQFAFPTQTLYLQPPQPGGTGQQSISQ